MNSEFGELIVPWTARLAVAAYIIRLLNDIAGWPRASSSRRRREQIVRGIWIFGCAVYLLHVVTAFHFAHHWSHAAAVAHTAEQTEQVTGWSWGGGLWINYAMTVWWPLDVAWSWKRGLDRLPRWYVMTLHGVIGFLMFNATVVFGPPFWRWAAVVTFGCAVLLFRRRRARKL